MPDIYLDEQIKIEYDPVTLTELFRLNAVGPCGWIDIDEVVTGYDASEYNHVNSSTGSDSTGDGTASLPYATEIKAIDSCTVDKQYVLIQDSGEYSGDYTVLDNEYYQGSFAASGETPKRCLRYIETELTDTNCICVDSDTGDDGNAGTEAAPKATLDGVSGAFSALSATKMYVKILNSGEYEITGCALSEHLDGIFAAVGESPTIKVNRNYDQVLFDTQKTISYVSDSGHENVAPILRSDGSIVLIYFRITSAPSAYYTLRYKIISGTTFDPITAETEIVSKTGAFTSACKMQNGDIFVAYKEFTSSGYGAYMILDGSTLAVKKSETIFHSVEIKGTACVALDDGNIFIAFGLQATDAVYFVIIRMSDYVIIHGPSLIYSSVWSSSLGTAVLLDSGNVMVSGYDGDGIIATIDMMTYAVSIQHSDFFGNYGYYFGIQIGLVVLPNGDILASGHYDDGASLYYHAYIVIDGSTFGIKSHAKNFNTSMTGISCQLVLTKENHIFHAVGSAITPGDRQLYFIKTPNYYDLSTDHRIIFHGLHVEPNDRHYLNKFIADSGGSVLEWSQIQNAANPAGNIDCIAFETTGEPEIHTSIIIDSDIGADITADKAILQNSVFARITEGYAVSIDGAAASDGDILIKNCTIFSNGGGIKLVNNDGTNETLEGLILHDNADTDIDAETAITLSRSVSTGALNNVVKSNVIQSNPAFVNEGYINPDNMNLDLMSKLLGYLRTSPAIGLCSDSKNAGAYDVLYVGVGVNWSSITVRKPEVIPIQRIYAGAVNLQLANGDYDSYHEGRSEKIELKFQGVENDEYDDLDKIMSCKKNSLKVYFAPTSRTAEYFAFKLLRETINAGNSHHMLDQYGKEDFSIFIARAYERTDG